MTPDATIEQEIQSRGLTARRVTPAQIDRSIKAQYTFTAYNALGEGVPRVDELKLLTIAVLVLNNGFTVTGESACASPENFDAELGAKIAVQNAKSKIWALEGYFLKSMLTSNFVIGSDGKMYSPNEPSIPG
jgi:Phage protein (N4 Gp49/phage Sf6 gene 66) family